MGVGTARIREGRVAQDRGSWMGDNRQRGNNENSGRKVGEKGKGRDDPSAKTSSKAVSGDFLSFREGWVSSWYISR